MRLVFEHWKYIFRNLWFVLPFAVMPAVFLALSVDFTGIQRVASGFFTQQLELDLRDIFRAWSFFRFDTALGILYSVLAIVCIVIFTTFLTAFAEKHMRIGKRTMSGVFTRFGSHMLAVLGILALYLALYELWAFVLSAVIYAICAIEARGFACLLFSVACALFMAVLLYLTSFFYLWLPCLQITGFRAYEGFLYSYRLMMGVRWKLILSMLITYAPCFIVLVGIAFAPTWLSPVIAFILFVFAYLSFCIRMMTVYFETDKLDREDLLRSFREL